MFLVTLLTVVIAMLTGLAIKAFLEWQGAQAQISWRELVIGLLLTPIVAGLVAWAGFYVARENNLTFYEYLNGWETAAIKQEVKCSRDGPCRHEYSCDPYVVPVTYSCNCNKNGCSTCVRMETRYHSCPYVDAEYNYAVKSTLREFSIASFVFPNDPQSRRWRKGKDIPSSVIANAGVGDPPFWTEAKRRIDANAPGPVSIRSKYDNYILASDRTLMKEYSSDIALYNAAGKLPTLPKGIVGFYGADKVRFVGFTPANAPVWRRNLEYLDAALGSQLWGDLMLVIIKDKEIAQNPDRYAFALKAYWQDKASQEDQALSKNGIVVLLGTEDGTTVSWSRGFTGMPIGNEKLIVTLRDGLKGSMLDPDVLIGPAVSVRDSKGVHHAEKDSSALLPRLLWGKDDRSTRYEHIEMTGKDGKSGFLYLKNEILPTKAQLWWIEICAFVLCMGLWIWASAHYDPTEGRITFRSVLDRYLNRKNRSDV